MADSTLYSVNPAGYGKAPGAGAPGAPGAPGKDGKSAYLYVAYASSATGAGFSLTPTNSLKFRAEIHTDTPIASPTLADFSEATWVKYIGDDGTGGGGTGTGNGDMLRSVYDADYNGVVDAAEKLQVAHKIGDASFDGTQDITLAQIGAQPTLPSGAEGQLLKKTASGVEWADAPVSLPPGGTTGQVLTKTDTGSGWASLPEQKPAEWGKIEGTLDRQVDLKNALDAKITSPETGVVGNYLKKTASGVEWADAPTGSGAATWGTITGKIPDQTDLKRELDAKITNPLGGTETQVLTKTKDGGEEWKSLPQTINNLALTTSNPDEEEKIAETALAPLDSTSRLYLAGNEYQSMHQPSVCYSMELSGGGEASQINDTLLRGHIYRRTDPATEGNHQELEYKRCKLATIQGISADGTEVAPGVVATMGGETDPVLDYEVETRPLVVSNLKKIAWSQAVEENDGWYPYRTITDLEVLNDRVLPELKADRFIGAYPLGYLQALIDQGKAPGVGNSWLCYKWDATLSKWRVGRTGIKGDGTAYFEYMGVDAYTIDHLVFWFVDADKTSLVKSDPTGAVALPAWETGTETNHNIMRGVAFPTFQDLTPTILSIEPLSGSEIKIWPCRAYSLEATENTSITVGGAVAPVTVPDLQRVWTENDGGDGPVARPQDQPEEWTKEKIERPGLRQESYIDITTNGFSITAVSPLIIVDRLVPGVVNHCRVVWDGLMARLYVYDAESPRLLANPVYIRGTKGKNIQFDLKSKLTVLDSTGLSTSLPVPDNTEFEVLSSNPMPLGVDLSKTGLVSGIPTNATSINGSVAFFTADVYAHAQGYIGCTMHLYFEVAEPGDITATDTEVTGTALIALSGNLRLADHVTVSNKRAPVFKVATDSALPDGVKLDSGGYLSGTPTASGDTTTTVTVSAPGCDAQSMTVSFKIAKGTITVPEGNVAITGTIGLQTSYSLKDAAATNNNQLCDYAFATGSSLPDGLSLHKSTSPYYWFISGTPKTPTYGTPHETTLNITATECTPATVKLVFTINDTVSEGTITASDQTVNGTKDEPLTAQLVATASNSMTCTFAPAEGASLPPGINMEATGKITGTPDAAGTSAVKVKISARNCPDVEMTVTFNIVDSIPTGTIEVTTNPTIHGVVGTALSPYDLASCVTVSNGQTPSFRWNVGYSSQPLWLTLKTSGELSGTPASIPSPTTGKVLVSAYKCSNEPNMDITWDIIAAGIITVVDQTIKGTVGKALSPFNLYDRTVVSNSQTPTFAVKSGTLPTGIDLSPEGVFTGTPSATSSATVVVKITARGCPTKDVNITFDITEAQAGSDDFPVSFTVTESQGLNGQGCIGTYTRTGNTLALDGVNYPVYSFTNASGKVHYIHISKWVYEGMQVLGTSWILDTRTSFTAESPIRVQEVYGTSRLEAGTYKPSSTHWNGDQGAVVVSWAMGNAGTPALTAKAFGHPGTTVANMYKAVLQTYTYTDTFQVKDETFPYYTGGGATPWYLFGGKARLNNTSATVYAVYLSSQNPSTMDFNEWQITFCRVDLDSSARLILLGETGNGLTYADVSGKLPASMLSSGAWWRVADADYNGTQGSDTITWE